MEGGKMNKIPSDEEFANAKRRMRELDRNMNQISENTRRYFAEICPDHSHNAFVLAEAEGKFRVYLFYKRNAHIQSCGDSGVPQKMADFVLTQLEKCGRGRREDIKVTFEFDSDENVAANYEGDYFLRLR